MRGILNVAVSLSKSLVLFHDVSANRRIWTEFISVWEKIYLYSVARRAVRFACDLFDGCSITDNETVKSRHVFVTSLYSSVHSSGHEIKNTFKLFYAILWFVIPHQHRCSYAVSYYLTWALLYWSNDQNRTSRIDNFVEIVQRTVKVQISLDTSKINRISKRFVLIVSM